MSNKQDDEFIKNQVKRVVRSVLQPETEKKSEDFFLQVLYDIYKEGKFSAQSFKNKLLNPETRKAVFNYYDIDEFVDYNSVINYNKAVNTMISYILNPDIRPKVVKEKRTIAGLSIPTALLAMIIGISEGASKK